MYNILSATKLSTNTLTYKYLVTYRNYFVSLLTSCKHIC